MRASAWVALGAIAVTVGILVAVFRVPASPEPLQVVVDAPRVDMPPSAAPSLGDGLPLRSAEVPPVAPVVEATPPLVEPAWRIRVQDRAEGGPVEGVEASSSCSDLLLEPEQGPATFRVRAAPATDGGCQIFVRAPGYVPAAVRWDALEKEETIVRLQRAGTVRGRVLASDGAPCAGAQVHLSGITVTADENGVFEATPLPLDTAIVPHVRCERGYLEAPDPIRLSPERPDRQIDLRLTAGFSHVVEVVDEGGMPLPKARVILQNMDGQPPFVQREGTADEMGIHTFAGLRASTYRAAASLQGFDSAYGGDDVVGPDAPRSRRRVVLVPGGTHWIGGVVTDLRGRPLPSVVVTFAADPNTKTTTDEEGRFRFKGLTRLDVPMGLPKPRASRGVRLHLRKAGWSTPFRVVPWDREAKLVMAETASLSVRVVGPDGSPVRNLSVQFAPNLGEDRAAIEDGTEVPRQGADHFTTGASGTVRGKDLMAVAGTLILQEASGLWRPKEVPVDLSAGGTLDFGTVSLDSGAALQGEVRTEGSDVPPPSSSVAYLLADDAGVVAAASVRRGGFDFRAAPAGRWRLWVAAPGWACEPREVVLRDGGAERLDVTLHPLLSLRVEVVSSTREHLRGRVRFVGPDGGVFAWRAAQFEERGLLRRVVAEAVAPVEATPRDDMLVFEGLVPGEYEVELLDDEGRSVRSPHVLDAEHRIVRIVWTDR